MTEPVALKYRAFISYSHADTAAARWLHRGLEGFRIDRDLVGRKTPAGTVPATLKPIFRDRDDFTAGHSLTEQTLAALDASEALIVICSPASAKSHYVNEEIRLFKSRHKQRPVIPLIVAGKPDDAELECFPPALKFKVDAKGRIGKKPVDFLAADWRDAGDGKQLALAKVVAGLLGLSPDEIFRRAERERRRKARIRNGVIGVLAALAVLASASSVYAWQQLKTNEAFLNATLKTATDIVDTAVAQGDRYGIPRSATLALLTKAEALFDNMALLGQETETLRHRKAWMLIQFARNYKVLGDTAKWYENSEKAFQLLAGLFQEYPDDPLYARDLGLAGIEIGDVLMSQGNVANAQKAYASVLPVIEGLANANPGDAGLELDVAFVDERIGDAARAEEKLDEALQSYRASLAIREKLAAAEPGNNALQRDLSVAYEKLGDVLLDQKDAEPALKAYRDSLAIAERLAEADPDNAGWQRDLSVAYNKVGTVLYAQGDLADALQSFRDGLAIREALAKSDPGNAAWQRDLSISYERMAFILAHENKLADALEVYRQSLVIREQLAAADPNDAGAKRELAISQEMIGDVLAAEGNVAEALPSYRKAAAIRETLARSNPGNSLWQRELAACNDRIARLEAGSSPEAPAPAGAKP
jgi:tetratricopeptide (TPR) repeat protein